MAGGPPPKGPPLHKPSSSSSASSRKSRWESYPNATATPTTTNKNKNQPDPKSSKTKPGPSPKPSPAHPKNPTGPSPRAAPFPFSDPASFGPPPPPVYDFHMLERRTFVLADGSVRSYFALPPDYQDFPPPMNPPGRFMPFGPGGPGGPDYWNSLGLDGRGPAEGPAKRKYAEEEGHMDKAEELAMRRQQFMQYGNPNGFPGGTGGGGRGEFLPGPSSPFRREAGGSEGRANKYMRVGGGGGGGHESVGFRQGGGGGGEIVGLKHLQVDQVALKKAFLNFVKLIHENTQQRKTYLEDGKHGRLHCIACARSCAN
ncbi:hypothetical protein ACFX15_012135 [Malus domestica]